MRQIYFFVLFVFNCVCSAVVGCQGPYHLHLVHHNDFHARFEETSDDSLICKHDNSTCFGGLPRMVYEIEAIRRQYPESLLLDAGDTFQGTYWYTQLKWNVTQYFINLLNHDAHAIGNHEFDDDVEGLAPYLAGLKGPALAANMDSSQEPILKGLYRPYVIVERQDRKIGIIGVTTTTTKELEPTGNVKFTDPKEAAFRESKYLDSIGVDIIILLSHCGYPLDIEIAKDYGEYIDVIVGGHSHRDRTQIFPYLTTVPSSGNTKHEVLVLQADAFTKYLGSISITFDCKGNVVSWSGGPIELDNSIPEDEKTKEQLAPYAREVHKAANKVIGSLKKPMNNKDCVHGECLMGNFLTDAMKYTAQREVHSQHPFIAIIQRSNMRAVLPAGDLTEGSVVELFPYLDYLESFELRGKFIYEALERSASDLMLGKIFTGPWLLQVSGLQVIYNISNPEGQRVHAASVIDGSSRVPLEHEDIYQMVSPIYLSNGGDGYKMLNDSKEHPRTIGYDQNGLREYIQTHKSFDVNIEGRIIISS